MSQPTRMNPFATVESDADDSLNDFAPKPAMTPISPQPISQPAAVKPTLKKAEEKAQVARLAEESGFSINNFHEKPLPARMTPAADTILKTVRVQVSDWNRFQRWCHDHRYTHWEGFHVLVSSLPPKGN